MFDGLMVQASSNPQPEEISADPLLRLPADMTPATLNSERQERAFQLARSRQKVNAGYVRVMLIVIIVVVVFETLSPDSLVGLYMPLFVLGNAPVLRWQPITGWTPLLILTYVVLFFVLLLALFMPLIAYTGFILPRRYGLRKGTIWDWLGDLGKGLAVVMIQFWLLAEMADLFLAIQPETWWAWMALIQFLYSIVMARFSPTWLYPMLQKIEPLAEGEITQRLDALLKRLRIPACGIFQAKVSHRTNAVNAFMMGWGNGRRIILTDTMVQNFTLDEIEVIIAHELAHLVHHDIWTRLVMRGLRFLGFFYVAYLYLAVFNQPDAFLHLWIWIAAFCLLVAFIVLINRYRRYQEYQADEFALQITRNVQAFKDAMTRLTDMNLLIATSTKKARHPTSHPTLVKRLQHADEFAARNGLAVSAPTG
jgi:STE24 endopeptidase